MIVAIPDLLRPAPSEDVYRSRFRLFCQDHTRLAYLHFGLPTPAGEDPRAVAVDPSGRFVYVANRVSGDLSLYAVDAASGALEPRGTHPVGVGPTSIAIERTGRFLYVANRDAGTISALRIDVGSGQLTAVAADVVVAGQPRALEAHPDGSLLFATLEATGQLAVFRINSKSGQLMSGPVTSSGTLPSSVAVDPLGRFAFVTNLQPQGVGDLARFALDPVTGVPTLLGTQLAGVNPIDAALDPSGRFLYVASQGSDDVSVFAVDPLSGDLDPVEIVPAGVSPDSIVVSGRFGF